MKNKHYFYILIFTLLFNQTVFAENCGDNLNCYQRILTNNPKNKDALHKLEIIIKKDQKIIKFRLKHLQKILNRLKDIDGDGDINMELEELKSDLEEYIERTKKENNQKRSTREGVIIGTG